MDIASRIKAMRKYASGRGNMLLMIVFSFINVLFSAFSAGIVLSFSATAPVYFVALGRQLSDSRHDARFASIGIFVAATILMLYIGTYVISRAQKRMFAVGLALFAVDTAFTAILFASSLGTQYAVNYALELLFHAWVLYYLTVGTRAAWQLSRLTPEEIKEAVGELEKYAALRARDQSPQSNIPTENSTPLRSSREGTLLVSGEYVGLTVAAYMCDGTVELAVNGHVYAEHKDYNGENFCLTATVNGIRIVYVHQFLDDGSPDCRIVVGNELIAKNQTENKDSEK